MEKKGEEDKYSGNKAGNKSEESSISTQRRANTSKQGRGASDGVILQQKQLLPAGFAPRAVALQEPALCRCPGAEPCREPRGALSPALPTGHSGAGPGPLPSQPMAAGTAPRGQQPRPPVPGAGQHSHGAWHSRREESYGQHIH